MFDYPDYFANCYQSKSSQKIKKKITLKKDGDVRMGREVTGKGENMAVEKKKVQQGRRMRSGCKWWLLCLLLISPPFSESYGAH